MTPDVTVWKRDAQIFAKLDRSTRDAEMADKCIANSIAYRIDRRARYCRRDINDILNFLQFDVLVVQPPKSVTYRGKPSIIMFSSQEI